MMRSFEDIRARIEGTPPVVLAVAGGADANVIAALIGALESGLVGHAFVTGDVAVIDAKIPSAFQDAITTLKADSPEMCSTLCVELVRQKQADILVKGSVDSTAYLRAVVDRGRGLTEGSLLSNVTMAAMRSYPKLLVATDNGIVPTPDLPQKKQIILNTAPLFRGLGFETVKVAAVAATEKVLQSLPATTDAAALSSESRAGAFPGYVVDGPFGYDVAVSEAAAASKGLSASPVAGQADLVLFPTIEAANAVVKAWKYHGAALTGSLVLGACAPVLLNSRSDGPEARINALWLAIAAMQGQDRPH